ncbi:UDP-glycosyltransferase 92A1 [Tripterygium wilfordii]|uniref:UDP-glycosyltransferase 92A1 n=1 Tax=Tripterygium wilfordii TaxID=458696 RepID=UPI0018F839E5|nr:UDP-glycosyltransferase 92A1 [Tripterygium wilfordii]
MAEPKELNVVMFPFMAQGHIIPFVALALHIEQKYNHTITFINTPLNIKKLKSSVPPKSSIRFLEIPFNSSDHGLPPNSENTDVLPYPLITRLLEASFSLKPTFRSIVSDLVDSTNGHRNRVCVITDIFFGWTASVARELGVFNVIFSGAGGYGLACYYSVWSSLPHRRTDSDEFLLYDFPEASRIHVTQLPSSILKANGTDPWSVYQAKNLPAWVDSDGILFNSVKEIDQIGLMYFVRKLGRPVWSIGPILLSTENRAKAGKEKGMETELCAKWLDSKSPNSVLYISFGSNNTISASQMMELAMALLISGKNFIWVVRPPIGFNINAEFRAQEWLPEGFEEKTKERGLLVHKWASQVEILSHKSVSAFLTHCGWNSVLEALTYGVPMIGWAMAAEQFFNVKFLVEELGVCLEVARGNSCEVRHEDMGEKIDLVMNETDKGVEMRRKACELKEVIKSAMRDEEGFKGSSAKAMDDFFRTAMMTKDGVEC